MICSQVMAVGIDLPKYIISSTKRPRLTNDMQYYNRHYLRKEWLTYFMLMIPVMIFMWLVSGLFIWALIPTLDYVCTFLGPIILSILI